MTRNLKYKVEDVLQNLDTEDVSESILLVYTISIAFKNKLILFLCKFSK